MSESHRFRRRDGVHAVSAVQFVALIETNKADLTWKQIPTLFAVAGDGKSRVNTG